LRCACIAFDERYSNTVTTAAEGGRVYGYKSLLLVYWSKLKETEMNRTGVLLCLNKDTIKHLKVHAFINTFIIYG